MQPRFCYKAATQLSVVEVGMAGSGEGVSEERVAKPHMVWTHQGGQCCKDLGIVSVVLHLISSLPKSSRAVQ